MLSNIGMPGLIIILVIALIIFGPNKLPELGRAVGRTLGEFKNATKNLSDDDYEDRKKAQSVKTQVKEEVKEEVVAKADVVETTDEQKQ